MQQQRGKLPGVHLFLLGKDGNMCNVTVAAACCDAPTSDNYRWFFRCVEDSGVSLRYCPVLCAIDTELLSLESELGLTFRYCTRYIIEHDLTRMGSFSRHHHALVWGYKDPRRKRSTTTASSGSARRADLASRRTSDNSLSSAGWWPGMLARWRSTGGEAGHSTRQRSKSNLRLLEQETGLVWEELVPLQATQLAWLQRRSLPARIRSLHERLVPKWQLRFLRGLTDTGLCYRLRSLKRS